MDAEMTAERASLARAHFLLRCQLLGCQMRLSLSGCLDVAAPVKLEA